MNPKPHDSPSTTPELQEIDRGDDLRVTRHFDPGPAWPALRVLTGGRKLMWVPPRWLVIASILSIFIGGFLIGRGTAAVNRYRYATASWYGPGLYGNRTACGQRLTTRTWGVAHKGFRCGTHIGICYHWRCVNVPVVDRGPFISGREFDLTARVARRLRFSGVQRVRWWVMRG